jgi:hypothetical protein
VLTEGEKADHYAEHYVANYKSMAEVIDLFIDAGFKLVSSNAYHGVNFNAVFKRV